MEIKAWQLNGNEVIATFILFCHASTGINGMAVKYKSYFLPTLTPKTSVISRFSGLIPAGRYQSKW